MAQGTSAAVQKGTSAAVQKAALSIEGWLISRIFCYLQVPGDLGFRGACVSLADASRDDKDSTRLLRFQHLAVPNGPAGDRAIQWAHRCLSIDSLETLWLPMAADGGDSGNSSGWSSCPLPAGDQSRAMGELFCRSAGEGAAAWVAWLLDAQSAASVAPEGASTVLLRRPSLAGDSAILAAASCSAAAVLGPLFVLRTAASNGHADVVKLLLAYRARTEQTDENECTALHWAADRGHACACRQLLLGRARPDSRDDDDWTPLGLAADEGHVDACQVLLEAKAGVNIPDEDLRSPLWWATWRGRAETIDLLLAFRADPLQRDRSGMAPGCLRSSGDDGNTAQFFLPSSAR